MNRTEILKILAQHQDELAKRYGVTRLGVFGAVARGEATEASDVDVVIEMVKPDLFYMVHIKQELEDLLHCPVDIVHYRPHMNSYLKKQINRDGVYV
ncbi:MAG: nucleotidyltransferase family protein [Desulfuromusa sp.]|nr:nucleotidyltransferase family protein [Desulfuromusa sp.]